MKFLLRKGASKRGGQGRDKVCGLPQEPKTANGLSRHSDRLTRGRVDSKLICIFSCILWQLGDDLQDAIFFFGMSNSLVNPLIYGAFHLCPGRGNKSGTGAGNNNAYSLNR